MIYFQYHPIFLLLQYPSWYLHLLARMLAFYVNLTLQVEWLKNQSYAHPPSIVIDAYVKISKEVSNP